jgi:predicted homoserine dehydrogenase-like protein
MFYIDTALRKLNEQGKPIHVALVGAGFMGRAIANQIINSVPGMKLVAIANRTLDNAVRAYREAGVEDFRVVSTVKEFNDVIAAGGRVATEDAFTLCEAAGFDVIIEVTGAIEFGAQFVLKAFDCRKHVVTMNAELDATVGSILRRRAKRAGVVYTVSDGDQPGVEMNLWRFVKSIGLEPLVCGNIKGLQDAYRNPTTQKAFAEQWGQNPYMVTSFADGSKVSFEQACVANATGMKVEMRGMRGGDFDGHVDELCQSGRYDVDRLRALGGVVDYTVKSKPGPGVFVLATHDDPKQRHMLKLYKLGDGPLYSFYTPYHLCHFEVPFSVARAVLLDDSVVGARRPMVDVITLAKVDLAPGTVLDSIGGYLTYGQCENHEVARAERLLPQGLAEGCRLKRALAKDTPITLDDVEIPEGRACDRLRAEQDEAFPVQERPIKPAVAP